MNYLAHLYLSGNDSELIIGNFIADAVKGGQLAKYSPGIIKGIRLHRFIDSYTDSYPIVERSKIRLRPVYRKYSGVIVDVFYDHFLAVNWDKFSKTPLEPYIENIYSLLKKHYILFPVRIQSMLPVMIRQNWLLNYKNIDGIKFALGGLASRSTFTSKMELASDDLLKYYAEFEEEFLIFFPVLMESSADFINKQSN